MDTSLLIAVGASFLVGLLGTIITRLWIKPLVRYTHTRRKLDQELSHCLAIVNSWGSEKPFRDTPIDSALHKARKHAMDLVSGYEEEIPYWYRLMLDSRKESPTKVSGLLTNLAKIKNREQAMQRIQKARRALHLRETTASESP